LYERSISKIRPKLLIETFKDRLNDVIPNPIKVQVIVDDISYATIIQELVQLSVNEIATNMDYISSTLLSMQVNQYLRDKVSKPIHVEVLILDANNQPYFRKIDISKTTLLLGDVIFIGESDD